MVGKQMNIEDRKMDKKEVVKIIRDQAREKWQRKYENSVVNEKFDEIFPTIESKKHMNVNIYRSLETMTNQLITGHCKLNLHMSKITENQTSKCPNCDANESVIHYIYDCPEYEEKRWNEILNKFCGLTPKMKQI